jgi:uncharacterized integral membrane protein (TIGR00698 family)
MPPMSQWRHALATTLVLAGAAFALTPWCTPQIALGLGILLALAMLVPADLPLQDLARFLIQISVVLLGFMMDLESVLKAGAAGLFLAAAAIGTVFLLGSALRRALRIQPEVSLLITSGTAICGGSAIAAVGSAIRAAPASFAVAMAVVFVLNGVALYAFPWIGHALELTPRQFGAWAGIAIHDVSSVVGAAAKYDEDIGSAGETLAMAAVVKLCRVVWLVPIAVAISWTTHRSAADTAPAKRRPLPIPWFVLLFFLAAVLNTYIPEISKLADQVLATAKSQMRLALFLIGTGLSLAALRTVGWRPLVQGVTLWVVLGAGALLVVTQVV